MAFKQNVNNSVNSSGLRLVRDPTQRQPWGHLQSTAECGSVGLPVPGTPYRNLVHPYIQNTTVLCDRDGQGFSASCPYI